MARPARPEDLYTLHGSPTLQDPVLLIHLTGWIDAGLCAHEATETILGQIAPVTVAEFETEWLLDHRARRPTMHIVEGVNVGLDWPEITLVSGRDTTGNDILVLHGAEPDHNWRSFCDAVVSLSQRFGVRRVIGLGSYPASSPHTRPSRLSVTAATPDLASLGFTPATLDVPAGMQAALEMAHHAAGIESVGLWAQVPHYISGAHYPAASLALVDGLVGAAGVVLDSGQLAADALATRNRLDDLVDDEAPPPPPSEETFWEQRMSADRVKSRERMRRWKAIEAKPARHAKVGTTSAGFIFVVDNYCGIIFFWLTLISIFVFFHHIPPRRTRHACVSYSSGMESA